MDCLKKFNARRKLKVTLVLSKLTAKCVIRSLVGLFLVWGKDRVVALGQRCGGDGHLGIPIVKKGRETEWGGGCIWLGFPSE